MLDIKYIREHAEEVKKNCENRGVKVNIDRLLELDQQRRGKIVEVEELRASKNIGSRSLSPSLSLSPSSENEESSAKFRNEEIEKMREVGNSIKKTESALADIEIEYHLILKAVPNLTHPDVPNGGEQDFKVLETKGKLPEFKFEPKDHEELMLALDVIDFERGAKVAGTKFYFAKNELVRLDQALLHYGMDVLSKYGFTLMETPDIARGEVLSNIGFNPRGPEDQIYNLEGSEGLSLIATAEITLGGYHENEIIDLSNGPLKYVGLSHCFRKEAGSYGRESKGLYRVHQFTKLEMFVYCKPEESDALHDELLAIEREIVDGLDLPYQVIDTASRDLGAPAYRKFDIEAWMVMKGGYGEITSTSNCTDYQAHRLNTRYRDEHGDTKFVHTLNGTAIVTSRFPIAIFENYQTKDGSIKIPKVLQKYMGGLKEIKSKK